MTYPRAFFHIRIQDPDLGGLAAKLVANGGK
jgi:hypothetical protein